ncbi:hypothetical protein EMCRGX_G018846 [Ephydatia muelleri]
MWHLLIDKVEVQSATTALAWLELVARREGFLSHPKTRARVALLGPCFKMGQMKPPTANSLKRSREPCARRRDAPASHYQSSPRWHPPLERGSSGYEGLHRWVKKTLFLVTGALRTMRLYVPNFAPRGGSGTHPVAVTLQPTLASGFSGCAQYA